MEPGKDLRQAKRLERLFAIFLEEAKARPELASRLFDALGEDYHLEQDLGAPVAPAQKLGEFSLVAILHTEGEERLRQCLAIIPGKERLLLLAEEQHVPLDPATYHKTLPEIIDAVVEGVKFRLHDRLAASF